MPYIVPDDPLIPHPRIMRLIRRVKTLGEPVKVPKTIIEGELTTKGFTIEPKEHNDIKSGDTVYIIRRQADGMAVVKEAYKVTRFADEQNKLELVRIADPLGNLERRKEMARAIAYKLAPQIMPQIENMVADALTEKPVEKLEKIEAEVASEKPAMVQRKKGCIFLSIGEVETVL